MLVYNPGLLDAGIGGRDVDAVEQRLSQRVHVLNLSRQGAHTKVASCGNREGLKGPHSSQMRVSRYSGVLLDAVLAGEM